MIKNKVIKAKIKHIRDSFLWKKWILNFDIKSYRFLDLVKLNNKIRRKYYTNVYVELSQNRVYRYMDKYKCEISEAIISIKEDIKNNIIDSNSNNIYTMWYQGFEEAPEVVKSCVSSFNKLHRQVIILDKNNIGKYVSLPKYILDKYENGIISHAHFSDIVRTNLIVYRGGLWIDSTVFIADEVPEYMLNDFFVFKQSPQLNEVRSYGNWWISSSKNNPIMIEELAYLYIYWKHHNFLMDYYIFHIFFKKIIDSNKEYQSIMAKMFSRYTDDTHLLFFKYYSIFDDGMWQQMKKVSPVFKCTYKYSNEIIPNSFLDYLYKKKLN